MLADYFNNQLMPCKWSEVARTREKCLFKKVDVFMYLSVTHDNAFDLLYVAVDEINRCLTRCYHGKFVVKMRKNYLIIRQGLWRKRFFIIAKDEKSEIVALSNRRKSKIWILSKKLPFDQVSFENVLKSMEKQGFDLKTIEIY